jgi:hypothetical protein
MDSDQLPAAGEAASTKEGDKRSSVTPKPPSTGAAPTPTKSAVKTAVENGAQKKSGRVSIDVNEAQTIQPKPKS